MSTDSSVYNNMTSAPSTIRKTTERNKQAQVPWGVVCMWKLYAKYRQNRKLLNARDDIGLQTSMSPDFKRVCEFDDAQASNTSRSSWSSSLGAVDEHGDWEETEAPSSSSSHVIGELKLKFLEAAFHTHLDPFSTSSTSTSNDGTHKWVRMPHPTPSQHDDYYDDDEDEYDDDEDEYDEDDDDEENEDPPSPHETCDPSARQEENAMIVVPWWQHPKRHRVDGC